MTSRVSTNLGTFVVFVAALLLFGPTATNFVVRVTDISALRVLDGDIPYRDFWTMYAPGSFVTLAGAFAIFGRELMVSSIAGMILAATAVAAYHRLAMSVVGARAAAMLAILVTLTFYGTGYHNGLTSLPPAILLILVAVLMTASRCSSPGSRWAVWPGVLLGVAGLYKHDVGAFAVIGACAALATARVRAGAAPVVLPAVWLALSAWAIVLSAAGVLVAAGAGPDAWEDLIRFPFEDFGHVRGPEYFPIIPVPKPSFVDMAQELSRWGQGMLPTLAFGVGLLGLWPARRSLPPHAVFIIAFAAAAFWMHWMSAHVQMNTNAVTLAAYGGLIGAAGLAQFSARRPRVAAVLAAGFLVACAGVYNARRVYDGVTQPSEARERIGLPGLGGLRASASRAADLRALAAEIAAAAPPDAPLLFLSRRNDLVIYAAPAPFWLSPRRPATRYHEIHPGVTDVQARQQEMIDALNAAPLPVVVREHRFPDDRIELMRGVQPDVPVGSTILDEWVAARYETGTRIGSYEVMRARAGAGGR